MCEWAVPIVTTRKQHWTCNLLPFFMKDTVSHITSMVLKIQAEHNHNQMGTILDPQNFASMRTQINEVGSQHIIKRCNHKILKIIHCCPYISQFPGWVHDFFHLDICQKNKQCYYCYFHTRWWAIIWGSWNKLLLIAFNVILENNLNE